MAAIGKFTVSVSKKEVVAAVLPLQEHWLPLSNLDLLLPPLDVGVFFCYNNNNDTSFESMVGVLKKSLAQTLVSYYAFASEVVQNSVGEPELLCNNRGVDFDEAFADAELSQLNFYNPDESIEGKLIPKKSHGVVAIQATKMKCGGLVIGCTFDHRIADAHSMNLFLVTWAEMAQSRGVSVIPCFRRSLLNPRRPISCIDKSLDDLYVPISSMPNNKEENNANYLISRIYYIEGKKLEHLQSLAQGCSQRGTTKLEAFSSFLWKLVAEAAVTRSNDSKISKMGIVVDGRSRLSSNEQGMLMASYFGNVLSIPYTGQTVEDLVNKPLYWVANQVQELLSNGATKEHFLSLIDWVEANRPTPVVAKVYCSSKDDGPAFVVSSGQRFPVSKIDFGWGKPLLGSYHFPWGGRTGYVMPVPSPVADSDWIVYMHLSKEQLEFIETNAKQIFNPLTIDYLLTSH